MRGRRGSVARRRSGTMLRRRLVSSSRPARGRRRMRYARRWSGSGMGNSGGVNYSTRATANTSCVSAAGADAARIMVAARAVVAEAWEAEATSRTKHGKVLVAAIFTRARPLPPLPRSRRSTGRTGLQPPGRRRGVNCETLRRWRVRGQLVPARGVGRAASGTGRPILGGTTRVCGRDAT